MKVLFIHYAIKDKQGFGRTFMLAREICSLGNKVVLLTTQPSKMFVFPFHVEYRNKVKIIAFPEILPDSFRRTGFGFFSAILKIIYIIKEHKFDIVHSDTGHRPSAALPAFFIQFFYKVPHVMEWWDFFGRGGHFDQKSLLKKITFGYYDIFMQKLLMKQVSGLVVLSEFLKNKAIDYKIKESIILVLNGGCDISYINYKGTNIKIKKKNKILIDSLTFCFVGMNNNEFNDIIPFIKAINLVKTRLRVNWITTGMIIPEKLKKEYNITNELKELGWQDYSDFVEILQMADVFILIQKNNIMNKARWPNKLGDYLAAGRLILTNPVGEVTRLIETYPNAFVTCRYNVNDIVEKIEYLYKRKSKILSEGKYVRKISEELSWRNKAIILERFYKKILNQ